MQSDLVCPRCTLDNTCSDGINITCAECGYEWPQREPMIPEEVSEADEGALRCARQIADEGGRQGQH